MQKLKILIILMGHFGTFLCERDFSFQLERLEPIKGDVENLVSYDIRLRRRGEKYLANGFMNYTVDLNEDVQHSIKTTYSATGSSQFRSHPYTVQKSSACKFFKTVYRQYGQPWVSGHTDFPYIPEKGICPLPKGNYYIKDMEFDDDCLPDHAPRGLWRFEQIFEKNGKTVGGLTIFARITDKFARDYNVVYERLEPIYGEINTLIEYNVRITRRGHGDEKNNAINGFMVYYKDVGVEFKQMVRTSYSPNGSSKFLNHPYKLASVDMCSFFKNFYRRYGQHWALGHTNFPFIPEEGLCPIPKGNYSCVDMEFDEKNYPDHAPKGLWKIEHIIEKNGKVIGGLTIYVRVVDKV